MRSAAGTRPPRPTGRERPFPEDGLAVLKTDARGTITYANRLFCETSGYAAHEVVGRPASIERHPDMPACIFRRMWQEIGRGEVFVGILNLARDGAHYWVFAHITPIVGEDGAQLGYHATRRALPAPARARLEALYRELREIERRADEAGRGREAAEARLAEVLAPYGDDLSRFSLELVR